MRTRNRRGAATVELAVATIVLIPTILYAMFLEDLLFYKFDQEETVASTTWDYINQDFRKLKASEMWEPVVHSSRRTYADHTSAWNTYDNPLDDAQDEKHHVAMAAHQCWLAQGGKQVDCTVSGGTGMTIEPTFNFKNHGGLATCTGTLGVQNYFLSEKILGRYGKKDKAQSLGNRMADMHTGSDIHATAAGDAYLYPEMKFAVLHDSWALYKTDDIDPTTHPADQTTEFASWVRIPYGLRAGNLSDANKFADDAIRADILGSQTKIDGIGDTLLTPPVAWKKEAKREFGQHTASGWSDSRHSGTQGSMKNSYMGVDPGQW